MRERELVENERERGRATARNGEVSDVDRGIVVAEKRYRPSPLRSPVVCFKKRKGEESRASISTPRREGEDHRWKDKAKNSRKKKERN